MTFLNIKKDVKECHERREKLKLKEFDFDYPYEKMKIIFKVCWMMDMNIFKRRKRIMKKS